MTATPLTRPGDSVIWACCDDPAQLANVAMIEQRLRDDGDPIILLATLPAPLEGNALAEPSNRAETQAFLARHRPVLVLWFSSLAAKDTVNIIRENKTPIILLGATHNMLGGLWGRWIPGFQRRFLGQFARILCIDAEAAAAFAKAGADPANIRVSGPLEDRFATLPYHEGDRRDLAQTLGSRPIWLAAAARKDDIANLISAHKQASRRAHRLLLIVSTDAPEIGREVATEFVSAGFSVALRSSGEDPSDITQVFVADSEGELGLWYRVAPITFVCGSLSDGARRNLYEPAALGSAVVAGPHLGAYADRAARLKKAGAMRSLTSADDLGPAIETLLAADRAALLAHAAWDVTSRGADASNDIAEAVFALIAQSEAR